MYTNCDLMYVPVYIDSPYFIIIIIIIKVFI